MSLDLLFSGARLPFNTVICIVAGVSFVWILYLVVIVGWRNQESIRHLIGQDDPGGYSWELFQDRFKRLPSHCSKTPAGLRAKQIHDLRAAELEIESEVSAAISQAHLFGRSTVVSYAPTAAVLIGLLGTLYGLSDSVGKIKGGLVSLENVGVTEVKAAVLAATEGMSTAFVTTFVGVSAAVVLGLTLSLYRRWETGILVRLEELASLYFLPACQTSETSTIVESARALRRLQENLTEGVTQLLESFESKSETIGQLLTTRIQESLAALQAESGEVLGAFRETTGRINDVVGEQTDDVPSLGQQAQMLSTYLQTLETTLAEHRTLYQELDNRTQQTLEAQANLQVQENSRLIELHQGIADRVTSTVEEYRQAQQEAERSHQAHTSRLTELIAEASSSLGGLIDSGVAQATAGLTALRELYGTLEAAQVQLAQRTQELGEQISTVTTSSDEQWQRMATATQDLRSHVSDAGTAISALNRRLQEQFDAFQGQIQSGHDVYVNAIRAGQEGHVADVRLVMEQSDENLRAHYDRGLVELREAVAGASASINSVTEPVCNRLDQLRVEFQSQRDLQVDLISELRALPTAPAIQDGGNGQRQMDVSVKDSGQPTSSLPLSQEGKVAKIRRRFGKWIGRRGS
jgi:biopolymer transport protein ExbB/TolQ